MNKVFGISMDMWAALSAIGGIASAIGTVAAVIVALRLASRDFTPRLCVRTSVMQQIKGPAPGSNPIEFLIINGCNLGRTTINVKGVFWSCGWFRKQTFVTLPYNNAWSEQLPKEITHSQQILQAQPLDEFIDGLDIFVRYLKGRWYRRFQIRSFRCGLYTSNGDFSSPVDPRIRELIRAAYSSQNLLKSTAGVADAPQNPAFL
jgi:hypothetical protein